jgi:hypothetical protein
LVEHQLPKLRVAGSIPVVRSHCSSRNPLTQAGFGVSPAVTRLRLKPLKTAGNWRSLARNWRAWHLSWNHESGHRSRVILDLEQLRRGKRWTAPARQYLADASDDIDLLDLVDNYTGLVVDFDKWFGRVFLGAHLNLIEEIKRLELQLRSMYPKF